MSFLVFISQCVFVYVIPPLYHTMQFADNCVHYVGLKLIY